MLRDLTRRDFLKFSALASAYTVTGRQAFAQNPCPTPPEPTRYPCPIESTQVIVIGAGIAGLAAAQRLKDNGINSVVVLEARTRTGGRILTNRTLVDHQDNPIALDMGASWIHDLREPDNPIPGLAAGFNTRVTRKSSVRLYDINGNVVNNDTAMLLRFLHARRLVKELTKRQARAMLKNASLQSGFDLLPPPNLAPGALAKRRREFNYSITDCIEGDHAADISDLSLLPLHDHRTCIYQNRQNPNFGTPCTHQGQCPNHGQCRPFDNGAYRCPRGNEQEKVFKNGYDQIVTPLKEGLDIRLDTRVDEVDYDTSGVTVYSNGGAECIQGDYAIITLPLGVLKQGSVGFCPPLPQAKRTSISNLKMGVLSKVYLQFSEIFWPDVDFIDQVSVNKGQWSDWFNLARGTNAPRVLCALNGGSFGRTIEEGWDNETIVAGAMGALRSIWRTAPNPTGSLITRWATDPFSLGSYSHIPAGCSSADYDELAKPVDGAGNSTTANAANGRLFFAGEATNSKHPATVHGAYLSGRRAAGEVCQRRGTPCNS
jgi:monoamine oxidase